LWFFVESMPHKARNYLDAYLRSIDLGRADWYYAATCLNRGDLGLEMLAMVNRYYLPGTFNTGRFLVSDIGCVAGLAQSAASVNGVQTPFRQLRMGCR
jgi:hypothetical protein